MALTETEELELLELENENAKAQSVSRETPQGPSYLQNLAQPMVDTEAKLHARNDSFNALPLAQKPARFVNDLAGGMGDVVTGAAQTAVNLIPQRAQAAIGDVIEKPVQALGKGLHFIGDAIPQSIKNVAGDVAGAAKGFGEKHPIAAEYAKAIPNAAMLALPMAKGAEAMGSTAGNLAEKAAPIFDKKPFSLLRSESGAINMKTIPDIEAEAEAAARGATGQNALTSKDIKNIVGKKENTGLMSRIEPREATMIHEPLSEYDTPLPEYALQARKAVKDAREITPADMAGTKAAKTVEQITQMRRDIGAEKEALIAKNEDKAILIRGLRTKFDKLVKDRMGIVFDENGGAAPYTQGGRAIRTPSEINLVQKMRDQLSPTKNPFDYTGRMVPIRMADDIKAAMRDLVENHKASEMKQMPTVAEAIGKEIGHDIDGSINTAIGGNQYHTVNTNYGNIKKIETQLNKRLGEVVDPETGMTKHGASLIKAAVQSNARGDVKVLFDAVKRLTGVDLMKDAVFAESAMKAAGDARINNILESAGAVKQLARGGLFEKAFKVGELGYNKLRGDKLDELVNYFNKIHTTKGTPSPSTLASALKRRLGNEGAVGGENPQIHTDNFKQWFGDWKNNEGSVVVKPNGQPEIVYHGGNTDVSDFSNGPNRGKNIGAGFFTSRPEISNQYAVNGQPSEIINDARNGARSTPVYLDIKKPLTNDTNLSEIIDNDIDWIVDKLPEKDREMYEMGIYSKESILKDIDNDNIALEFSDNLPTDESFGNSNLMHFISRSLSNPKSAIGKEIRNKFDGIIYNDNEVGGTTYIPFSPSQIKSATGNSGAFSKATADIRGSSALPMLGLTAGVSGTGLTAALIAQAKREKARRK